MWVRSQDGEILANCDSFKIIDISEYNNVENRNYAHILGHIPGESGYFKIGTYSIINVIRILNELQCRVENGETGVYQMPYE